MPSSPPLPRRVALGLATLALARPALAQSWPARPPRVIVPYGAGNQSDLVARLAAEALGAKWNQRPVIENVTGAGGAIGTAQIARAAPDGYSFGLVAIAALAVTPHMTNAGYDPLADLVPLASVGVARLALVVPASLPARDLAGFVALARARANDPLFYYSPGNGTIPHLNGELLRRALDFPASHVPYRTAAGGIADLIAGRVHFALDSVSVALPHIEAGRLRAILSIARDRLPQLPDVPSLGEAAPGVELPDAWNGFYGPRGFPAEVADRIAADTAALLADPGFVRRLPPGTDPMPMDRATMAAQIRRDHARFGALVRELDLREG